MARPSHSEHVLQQLNSQREWGFLCDVLIAIGDIYFRAHKAVLAACSSYFRMLFIREAPGGGAGRLDLSSMPLSAECFDLVLQLMYLGRIVVGGFQFDELKACMSYLQMYYVPESLEELRAAAPPARRRRPPPPASGRMMFGVRMYDAERPPKPASSRPPAAEEAIVVGGVVGGVMVAADGEQPCDLRKRGGGVGGVGVSGAGRAAALKERPRFGRTFTCDDCGFVFSCEKLLIEHILTCTNRKAFPPPPDPESSASSSSAGEEPRPPLAAQGPPARHIKTEPEDAGFPNMEPAGGGLHAANRDSDRDVAEGGGEGGGEGEEPGDGGDGPPPAKVSRVKEEEPDGGEGEGGPCELCGAALGGGDRAAHYLDQHLGHICACGRCGRVLLRGRQLQEHAERCGEEEGANGGEEGGANGGEEEGEEGEDGDGEEEGEDLGRTWLFPPALLEDVPVPVAVGDGDVVDGLVAGGDGGDGGDVGEQDHRRKHFCSICGKGFFQRCHLREHHTVHTRQKQFRCQTCGKQFLRERQLRLHADRHAGVARYLCPVCEQGAFLKHDHVRHMVSHLSAGQAICQVCCQIFPSAAQLQAHMDVHLYVCGVCGEKFRLRKDMRSHYISNHTKRLWAHPQAVAPPTGGL
ncbi:zinc finger and BTB domain-containing protein 1 [Menidia menidia]